MEDEEVEKQEVTDHGLLWWILVGLGDILLFALMVWVGWQCTAS